MATLHRLAAVYLGLSALAVGVHFLFSPFYADGVDVEDVWYALDIVMAVGILFALADTFMQKRGLSADASTLAHVCAYTAFYATATLALLFCWNWFDFLINGSPQGDVRDLGWVAIDTLYVLVAGTVGLHLWRRDASA